MCGGAGVAFQTRGAPASRKEAWYPSQLICAAERVNHVRPGKAGRRSLISSKLLAQRTSCRRGPSSQFALRHDGGEGVVIDCIAFRPICSPVQRQKRSAQRNPPNVKEKKQDVPAHGVIFAVEYSGNMRSNWSSLPTAGRRCS